MKKKCSTNKYSQLTQLFCSRKLEWLLFSETLPKLYYITTLTSYTDKTFLTFFGGYTFIAYEAQTLQNDKYKFCMLAWDINAIKTEDL